MCIRDRFLTDSKRFTKIQHFYPVRWHSYLPCHRDFGLIKRLLRRTDRIFSLHEITELIIKCSKPGKFIVKEVQASEISDFKGWWKAFYKNTPVSQETKKKPKDEKVKFDISSLYHFVFESKLKGYIKAYTTINGLNCQTFFMSSTKGPVTPPSNPAYSGGKVGIELGKITDIGKVIRYVLSLIHI